MMKIASKWADAEVKKASVEIESPEDPDDPPEVTATSLFDKQQEDLLNIQVVQNNLGDIKEIGKTDQKSSEDAKKKVMEQPAVEKVNNALMQMHAE